MTIINLGRSAAVGMVAAFVSDFVPVYWLELAGQSVPVADYPELSLVVPSGWIIGSNIVLPNMIAASPVGKGVFSGRDFALGSKGGQADVALTEAQVPAHTHNYDGYTGTVNVSAGAGEVVPDNDTKTPRATTPTGSGDTHENMSPYLVVTWAIFAGR